MLNINEAAKLIGIHPNTLRRWSDKNLLPSFIISTRGDRRYHKRDIERFLAMRRHQ